MKTPSRLSSFLTPVKALQVFHLFRQGAGIFIGIALAKGLLATQAIGAYEQLLYLGYTLTFFWITGLLQSMLTVYPNLSDRNRPAFFLHAYGLFLGLAIMLFLVIWAGEKTILRLLLRQERLDYFWPYCLFLLVNLPTYLLEHFYLLQRKALAIVSFGAFSFGLQVVATLGPLLLGAPFLYSFYALIALAILKHLWLLFFLIRHAAWRWDEHQIVRWLQLALPLILYALIGGFNSIFDNWLVNFQYEGDAAVFAIFRYGARELPLSLAMTAAFSTSMLPEVAESLADALQKIKQKSLKLFHLLFPFAIFAILFSKWGFPLVFNEGFQESALIFNIYVLVLISRLVFPHTLLIGMKDNKVVLLISIAELVINIVVSLTLAPFFGLAGIAMGTVIAFSADKALMMIYLYRRYQIAPTTYLSLRPFLLYAILLIGAFLASLWF